MKSQMLTSMIPFGVASILCLRVEIGYFPTAPFLFFYRYANLRIMKSRLDHLSLSVCICLSLLPLFFGMIRKSTTASIIASFLLVVLLIGTVREFSFNSSPKLSITLVAVAIILAICSIQNIDTKDVN